MSKQSGRRYRHELLHGEDADFVAHQRDAGHGRWQTVSTWRVPAAGQR